MAINISTVLEILDGLKGKPIPGLSEKAERMCN